MAMEADREAVFPMVLARHLGLPEGERPRLLFRHPMRRDTRRLGVVLKKLDVLDQDSPLREAESVMDELERLVKSLLVGWERQRDEAGEPLPFAVEDLDRVVDDSELGELAQRLRVEPGLTLMEKKTSALRSASSSGLSVAGVPAEGTDAAGDASAGPKNESGGPSSSSAPVAGAAAESGGGSASGVAETVASE